ncbi:Gfo/Idh/MocA family oxidoreductase [Flammeovirgaceae bacterium SG7u.111]|nr:Gfo/Idh/MocA family oxidoreductase [Flammeovirgaceae bacterium SG7u.132]WPO35687.1 Gfo/Idh/MocA family oxidoreductase [Flammeovirgaceae bacterium SG7u.111]
MERKKTGILRRDFVKGAAAAAGGIIMTPLVSNATTSTYNSSVDDTIKIALVGCGGRGTGAAVQALSTKQNLKLVAMCDAFEDRLETSLGNIMKQEGYNADEKVAVKKKSKFVGFDGYKKAIDMADVVILATPPGFRPIHFEYAIEQGKHIFMEKPVATDAPGIRKVLATAEKAKQKKLNVVVGLQRHYQTNYRELMKRVHDGAIGEITSAQAYWNGGGVWVRPRKEGMTEMEYQMRNWYYFNWLCGDHIAEQHVHNLDVVNWAKQSYPVRAQGMGGREVRKGKENGEIFDHHFVEFEYEDGSILSSQCRHIKGCMNRVSEFLHGTKGRASTQGKTSITDLKGNVIWSHRDRDDPNPYQQEHDELFDAIAKGEYKYADAENGAKSTMTAILGRLATYSGQLIEWDDALNSDLSLMPKKFAFDAEPPILPDSDGFYPSAIPGVTKVL